MEAVRGGGLHALFRYGRRKKKAGWAKRPDGPAGRLADGAQS
jgi:hypothetical protein